MKIKKLKELFQSNLYLLLHKQFYQVTSTGLKVVEWEQFQRIRLPFLIIARENLQVKEHQIPVTDPKDVKNIIRSDLHDDSFITKPEILERQTKFQSIELAADTKALIADKLLLWCPETVLIEKHILPEALTCFSRANQSVYAIKHGGSIYSSPVHGMFEDANYFLMSTGAIGAEKVDIEEKQYCHQITTACMQLQPEELLSLLKAQWLHKLLIKLTPWKSLGAGIASGLLLALIVDIAVINMQIRSISSDIEGTEVAQLVKRKQFIEGKQALLKELSENFSSKNNEMLIWEAVVSVMEKDIRVLRVTYDEGQLQLRLESDIATDSLEAIRSLPLVTNAEFVAAVQNSLGKQRFTVQLTLVNNAREVIANG
ncbi:MAG: hypothetical protein ACFHVJ_20260 [Aestuariibacter sp.]